MVIDRLTDRLGLEPIISVRVNLTVIVMETWMEMVCVNGPLVQTRMHSSRMCTAHLLTVSCSMPYILGGSAYPPPFRKTLGGLPNPLDMQAPAPGCRPPQMQTCPPGHVTLDAY